VRRSQIIHEFDHLTEILPIAMAGILLNVAGRQIAQYFGGPFVDMTGTAFTAFLLGPWWAAAVASATTIINGSFFESYFPFGVVNIAGGLVWGYIARCADLPNRAFARSDGSLRRLVLWTVVLTLAGGLACGLVSTCVKLVLYPELGRPFIYGPLYVSIHAALQQRFGPAVPEVATLVTVDLTRDVIDKLIVVPIAMGLVALTQIAPTFGQTSALIARARLVQTDVSSIFIFSLMYSAFILLAQWMKPLISIPGAQREIAWLSNPMMVVLLYAPLVVALLAFRFLTFRASDPGARRIHALCQERRTIRRKLFEAGGRWTSVVRSFVPQALGTGVSIWPLRHIIDPIFGVPLALGAITFALAAYLVVARVFYSILQRAMKNYEVLTRWLDVDSGSAASAELVGLMKNLFSAYISVPEPNIARRNSLVYTMGFLNREQRGWLEDLLFGRGEDAAGGRMAVLATIDPPRALTHSALEDVASLVHESGAGLVAIASTTPRLSDPTLINGLRSLRKLGAEILLFDWADVGLSIAAKALSGRPQATMWRSRARAFGTLTVGDERFIVEEPNRSRWLADRALPSLRTVIGDLPKASMVFDLGAGYGRHTMAASIAGHDVLAIEWKESVCERLRLDVEALAPKSGIVTVIHGDYLDVSPETAGLADLVICTGVLQHARNADDFRNRFKQLGALASQPAALVYIEMLFDMLFDGKSPTDGRMQISVMEFEDMLRAAFPSAAWAVRRLNGPTRQSQTFNGNGRSFDPPAQIIESTSVEYLIRRLE
jgi:hypothetical protein